MDDVKSIRSLKSDYSAQARALPPPPPTSDRDSDAAEGSSAVSVCKPQQPPVRRHHHRSVKGDQQRQDTTNGKELEGLKRVGRGDRSDSDVASAIRASRQQSEQDDNLAETTTAVTGTTSEAGFSSVENVMAGRSGKHLEPAYGIGLLCARYVGTAVAGFVGLLAFVSPIIMVVLPKSGLLNSTSSSPECRADCEGQLLGFAFKLVVLLVGSWALFFRRPRVTLPRISVFRAIVVLLVFIVTVAYWLFYGVRIIAIPPNGSNPLAVHRSFPEVVAFAVSMVDSLLFVHYLAVVLLELRLLQPLYVVKLVRSPDGQSHSYTVGQLSVQRLAVYCLDQYYRDFQVYNPYLDHVMSRRSSRMSDFKIYSLDGAASDTTASSSTHHSRALISSVSSRSHRSTEGSVSRGHNDRFYDELDYERKIKKRRARLVVAAEEAFTHVRRLQQDKGSGVELSPMEAAQAIFPGLARALQKYLRTTRQQPRYSIDSILNHLALCISHDMSPKAFVERYLSQGAIIWNDKDYGSAAETHTWSVVSATGLNVGIGDGTVVRIQRGDISLVATVRHLPHFNLTEDVFNPKNNKFSLRLSSETSV